MLQTLCEEAACISTKCPTPQAGLLATLLWVPILHVTILLVHGYCQNEETAAMVVFGKESDIKLITLPERNPKF